MISFLSFLSFLSSFSSFCLLSQDSLRSQADRAAYALLYATMELGYFVSQPKSTLRPVQRMVHLGLGIDSSIMAYFLTDKIRQKFRVRREELLASGTATERQMQSFVGKCNHLRSIFSASHLFTFHCRKLLPLLHEDPSPLPSAVVDELNFWGFVDSQTEPVPFRFHQHLRLKLFTDASGFGYGADVLLPSGPLVLRDYWRSELFKDICVKEALAVLFALQALPESVECRRVDAFVDNEGLFHAWSGLKSSSQDLVEVLRELFLLCVDLNADLRLHWIPTADNPADAPSRVLSRADSMLASFLRWRVWYWRGPFQFDLMALPSNAFCLPGYPPLPFFSPFPVPGSAGVDIFSQKLPGGLLYCYPPFVMISAVIGLFQEVGGVSVVLVLPVGLPSGSPWFPRLSPFVVGQLPLASPSDRGVVLFPSHIGYSPNRCPLGYGLVAFHCIFPPCPSIVTMLPFPSVRVLMVADSIFRPFADLVWPRPFAVEVVFLSGGKLMAILFEIFRRLTSSPFDICLFHGGVNDVSKSGDEFEVAFREVCSYAAAGFPSLFPGGTVFCSSVCQTRRSALNVKVCLANTVLRSFSSVNGWRFISHDNIHFSDLSDDVHLNAAGVAKLYRHITTALRSFRREIVARS